jgi:hypothetical protein
MVRKITMRKENGSDRKKLTKCQKHEVEWVQRKEKNVTRREDERY